MLPKRWVNVNELYKLVDAYYTIILIANLAEDVVDQL